MPPFHKPSMALLKNGRYKCVPLMAGFWAFNIPYKGYFSLRKWLICHIHLEHYAHYEWVIKVIFYCGSVVELQRKTISKSLSTQHVTFISPNQSFVRQCNCTIFRPHHFQTKPIVMYTRVQRSKFQISLIVSLNYGCNVASPYEGSRKRYSG